MSLCSTPLLFAKSASLVMLLYKVQAHRKQHTLKPPKPGGILFTFSCSQAHRPFVYLPSLQRPFKQSGMCGSSTGCIGHRITR